MRYLKVLGILSVLGLFFLIPAPAHAQVSVGIGIGPAYVGPPPVCAYGYYSYYPYACAPYGYYGPDWFVNGVFLGAGPWYGWGWNHLGYYGHGFYGGRGFVGRGAVGGFHGNVGGAVRGGGGFHSFSGGGFHSGGAVRGGGGFHGGGGRR